MTRKIRTEHFDDLNEYVNDVKYAAKYRYSQTNPYLSIAMELLTAPLRSGDAVWVGYCSKPMQRLERKILKVTPCGFTVYFPKTVGASSRWFHYQQGYWFAQKEEHFLAVRSLILHAAYTKAQELADSLKVDYDLCIYSLENIRAKDNLPAGGNVPE